MSSYLNKTITNAQENGFIFNQINKLTIKLYSNLSNKIIHYYLKLRIPIMHRHIFKLFSQNKEYVERFRKDKTNPFHFSILKMMSNQ